MSCDHDAGKPEGEGLNRRSFLQTSGGVATGVAVTVVPSAALALASPAAASAGNGRLGELVHPTGDVPSEPVMAYVHDAAKAEVTVLAGTVEKTYRDPVLAKRLLDAARAQTL
ncbi:MAG: hypothetical protein M3046_12970 [Actinomycetota bacterium]|nr:hypothetical protein [Actinomycetota bacterium]